MRPPANNDNVAKREPFHVDILVMIRVLVSPLRARDCFVKFRYRCSTNAFPAEKLDFSAMLSNSVDLAGGRIGRNH